MCVCDLALAEIIEPTNKAGSLWVFDQIGVEPVDYQDRDTTPAEVRLTESAPI